MAGHDFCYSLFVSQRNTSHSLAGLHLITLDAASEHANIAGRLCTTQQAFLASFAAGSALVSALLSFFQCHCCDCFAPNLSCLQAKKMAAVGAKEETFDVWMKQESDTVQALGMAYAERETIEASYRVIQQVSKLECIHSI